MTNDRITDDRITDHRITDDKITHDKMTDGNKINQTLDKLLVPATAQLDNELLDPQDFRTW